MRTNHLRTISHWFTWEDMDFPNPAVEERIRQKVAAAAAAKVELAVVFGYHFRWDYLFNFDLTPSSCLFKTDNADSLPQISSGLKFSEIFLISSSSS